MAKTFSIRRNKDAGDAYAKALLDAGYALAGKRETPDFMLIDNEHAGGVRTGIAEYLLDHPVFVYPHTPLSYFIWDGHYEPLPVQCNFVAGTAAKQSLEAYGYPNRVEMVGFGRCEIGEFQPTQGTRLLFVPARTRGNGSYSTDGYAIATKAAIQFVLDHLSAFETVTVCYVNDFVNEVDYLTSGIKFIKTDPRTSETPTADMVSRIDEADIVISCETVGCLSVARGRPTVFYNARAVAGTSNIFAANFEKYRQWYQFPLTLEEMNIDEVLAVRERKHTAVEDWKRGNIGGNFDAGKFLSVIGEYV
jgi:hypothetical protein